jgi:hypothetical protein
MDIQQKRTSLPLMWGLVLVALLAGCGNDSPDGQTVAVNLSLIVDGRQAQHRSAPSTLFAFLERWFAGGTSAWAQSVTEITSIQVEISGPGIPTPASTTVPVSDPTSGQEIPVSIQAPVGPNRTITVSAFNGASPPVKIFGGILPGVNLTAGAPMNLEITLVRLFTVTVAKLGAGSGTITSAPGGIECGATCENMFPQGTSVSLNAAAAPGSAFAGWSGACSGTGPCSIQTTATVTARFIIPAATNRLTVNKDGSGTGLVTSDPSGIFCGNVCSADFETGRTVTLNAATTNGSAFIGWSGGGCSGTGPCIVALGADLAVTATFAAAPAFVTLTVIKLGLGEGTVSSEPPGITNCSATCTANFVPGTRVDLTATATNGSTFEEWGGACEGKGACAVTMDGSRTVTATFNPPLNVSRLTIQKTGTGTGRITSTPNGIDCGSRCVALFATGSTVRLAVNPDTGSTFTGWTTGPCMLGIPCIVVMDTDQTIVANFDLAPGVATLPIEDSRADGTVRGILAGVISGLRNSFPSTVVAVTANVSSRVDTWRQEPCDDMSGACIPAIVHDRTANLRFIGVGGG